MTTDDEQLDDVVVEITNGKKVTINLNPLEWLAISIGIGIVSAVVGYVV